MISQPIERSIQIDRKSTEMNSSLANREIAFSHELKWVLKDLFRDFMTIDRTALKDSWRYHDEIVVLLLGLLFRCNSQRN